MGAPIEMRLPLNLYDERTSAFFEGKLGTRIDALIWFTRGLALDLSGRHEDALALFKQAEPALAGWKNDQGKEILAYFVGREALFLGRYDPQAQDATAAAAYLAEAEAAFRQALDINPAYVRAHIGLGGVYFQRAQHLPPAERLQTNDLIQAIEQYRLAVEQDLGAAGIQLKLKGYLGLGVAYRLQGEAYLHAGNFANADTSFDRAITELNQAVALLTQDQHRLLAQAYLGLGSAYEQKAHIRYVQQNTTASKPLFEEAADAYQQCSDHADQEFYDSLLQDLKSKYCDPYRQDVQKVLDSL
jgi:tetratricopeptide (TPR) repeat protein